MQWLENITRPEIWKMAGYSSARSEMSDTDGMIQLDANENPYEPYPLNHGSANRYPDPQPKKLTSRLAAIYSVQPNQILVTRGMDEVIDLLVRVFCVPYQDSIVITPPTFGFYKVAADIAVTHVVSIELEAKNDFELDVDKLITTCVNSNKIKIIFLCTPNNPTGNIIDLGKIEKIAKFLPNTIIAVDEAYIEFADTPSAVDLLDQYPNLLVMRTLSKAYAAAGVRIGTLIAHPEIIKLVAKVLPPYPLPLPSIKAALDILSPFGLELAHRRIELLKQERKRMYLALVKLNPAIHVYKSAANFLLLKVDDAKAIYKKFLAHGIIIRDRSKDIVNTIRISVGTPHENNLVLKALGVKLDDTDVLKFSNRHALVVRKTNETEIMAQVDLDQTSPIKITTGIGFFDHMLEQLARHGGFSLQVSANGDTHIDYHHTVEDVAIVLGQALCQALGEKRGINRYGFVVPMDEALAEASIDLSGRGVLVMDAKFPTPMIGDFPVEMVQHFFLTFATHLKAAIHLKVTGENSHHMVEGLFKACAKALNQAITINSDRIPSTKGVL